MCLCSRKSQSHVVQEQSKKICFLTHTKRVILTYIRWVWACYLWTVQKKNNIFNIWLQQSVTRFTTCSKLSCGSVLLNGHKINIFIQCHWMVAIPSCVCVPDYCFIVFYFGCSFSFSFSKLVVVQRCEGQWYCRSEMFKQLILTEFNQTFWSSSAWLSDHNLLGKKEKVERRRIIEDFWMFVVKRWLQSCFNLIYSVFFRYGSRGWAPHPWEHAADGNQVSIYFNF